MEKDKENVELSKLLEDYISIFVNDNTVDQAERAFFAEGIQSGLSTVAIMMLNLDLDVDLISKVTGFSAGLLLTLKGLKVDEMRKALGEEEIPVLHKYLWA